MKNTNVKLSSSKLNFKTTLICLFVFTIGFSQGQSQIDSKPNKDVTQINSTMKTYLIERDIPDAGKLTQEQLQGISKKSNAVVTEMGPKIEWLHSYVTHDKVYCVYRAESKGILREHAEKGGFPANRISELSTKINPDTGKD